MNEKLYDKLMLHRPSQQQPEWHLFLQLCEWYLEKHKIEKPVVVELGCLRSKQRRFYEQLFGAEWIGVDKSAKGNPTIHGDTHDPATMAALVEKLNDREIDILFIDAGHRYTDVRQDFEGYAPLCSGIIVIHDTEIRPPHKCDVRFFWNELIEWSQRPRSRYGESMFINLCQYRYQTLERRVGIGVIIQR